jgi:hypothetical protein
LGPYGRRIAFVRNGDIWMMGARGRNQRRVTTATANDFEPTFSRDGTTLAFVSNRTGQRNIFELRSHRPYGRPRQITHDTIIGSGAEYPSFAPDGSLYWIERATYFTVTHANADGSNPVAVKTCYGCWALDLSPTGGSLLYSLFSPPTAPDCGQLVIYDLGSGQTDQFPPCDPVHVQGLTDASWSPSGTRLTSKWFDQTGVSIVTTDLSGGDRRTIAHDGAGPVWQPRS